MKKLILIALLIVGCDDEEVLENCVLKGTIYINYLPFVRYECYENVYTKKECMDKVKQIVNMDITYNDYITESCSDFCADIEANACIEY